MLPREGHGLPDEEALFLAEGVGRDRAKDLAELEHQPLFAKPKLFGGSRLAEERLELVFQVATIPGRMTGHERRLRQPAIGLVGQSARSIEGTGGARGLSTWRAIDPKTRPCIPKPMRPESRSRQ